MNRRRVLKILGKIILTEAILMVPSLIVALIYKEGDALYLFCTIIFAALLGLALSRIKAPERKMGSRDGYCIVALAWVIISLIGAIPFYMTGQFRSYWSALFEIVSGFTTTGASVLAYPELLPHGVQFWRCFTHWVGGMGVLVFVMMVMPMENENSMHLVRAEVPGPIAGKLVPRMKKTSVILYGIYTAMTAVLVVLLLVGGMDLFDALTFSFGTAGTGGFSTSAAGIAGYNSAYIEIVIGIFMLLFGINFNAYYLILIKRFKDVLKMEEVRWYLGVVAFAVITITVNICTSISAIHTSLRQAFFQVSSIITTTGFATVDFDKWPEYSRHLLVLLMIIGACSGSTGGGLKVSRVIVMVKSFFTEIRHIINPNAVTVVRLNGKPMDKETLISVRVYVSCYFMLICIFTLIISINGFDMTTNLTAVLSCLNNIGPGLGVVGPMSNFSGYSDWAQFILSIAMLMGRLEIFPVFMLFSRSAHRR